MVPRSWRQSWDLPVLQKSLLSFVEELKPGPILTGRYLSVSKNTFNIKLNSHAFVFSTFCAFNLSFILLGSTLWQCFCPFAVVLENHEVADDDVEPALKRQRIEINCQDPSIKVIQCPFLVLFLMPIKLRQSYYKNIK